MYYRTRAVILKSKDYRDADKLMTVFSEKEGKFRAIARGVKKPRSTMRASLQPFCHSQLYLNRGKDLDLITQTRLLSFYGNIREDLTSTLQVIYLLELLDKALVDRVPMLQLYQDVFNVLEALEQIGYNPLFIRYAELSVLTNSGYKPVMNQCVHCHSGDDLVPVFDLPAGGVVCKKCQGETGSGFALSGEALAILRMMLHSPLQALPRVKAKPASLEQLELFLERYLEYHLESRFKMKDTMRKLKSLLSGLY
ncbi:MAG: DNA repair protein RecO [Syntrophomonas sp.]